MSVVQAYAPKNDAMDKEKDKFYNQLLDTVSRCNRNDMIVRSPTHYMIVRSPTHYMEEWSNKMSILVE